MIKRLVAIGGGNWQQKETKHIDQKIIEMSEKPQPRVLFFPTALKDDQGYAKRFKQYYRLLGCHVDAIRLLHSKKTYEQLEKEWLDYDILYLGGGDTKLLMDTLVSTHTDQIIRKAYEAGIIIAGYSAGANDLFHFGYAKQDEVSQKYMLSYKIVSMAGKMLDRMDILQVAKPYQKSKFVTINQN